MRGSLDELDRSADGIVMDLPEIDPAVRAKYPSYRFDHARGTCPFEDPATPVYRATNLDRDGKSKPFRPYRDEVADRRWLTSIHDGAQTMIEVFSPYSSRFDRSSTVVEFLFGDEPGGMRFEGPARRRSRVAAGDHGSNNVPPSCRTSATIAATPGSVTAGRTSNGASSDAAQTHASAGPPYVVAPSFTNWSFSRQAGDPPLRHSALISRRSRRKWVVMGVHTDWLPTC
jgi:hypothetical protein